MKARTLGTVPTRGRDCAEERVSLEKHCARTDIRAPQLEDARASVKMIFFIFLCARLFVSEEITISARGKCLSRWTNRVRAKFPFCRVFCTKTLYFSILNILVKERGETRHLVAQRNVARNGTLKKREVSDNFELTLNSKGGAHSRSGSNSRFGRIDPHLEERGL